MRDSAKHDLGLSGRRILLDARYEKVREAGIVMSQAVLIAVGIDWETCRNCLSYTPWFFNAFHVELYLKRPSSHPSRT